MASFSAVIDVDVGDDWTVSSITLTVGDGPADLTGAQVTALLYARDQLVPVATLTETLVPGVGGLTVAADRTTGVLTEAWIAALVTSSIKAQDRRDLTFPTRLAILVTDSRGREVTFLIIPFRPLDRGSELPASGVLS